MLSQLPEHFIPWAPQVHCLYLECSSEWLSWEMFFKFSLQNFPHYGGSKPGPMYWGDGVGWGNGLKSSDFSCPCQSSPIFPLQSLAVTSILSFREKDIVYTHLLKQIGTQGCNQSTSSPKQPDSDRDHDLFDIVSLVPTQCLPQKWQSLWN